MWAGVFVLFKSGKLRQSGIGAKSTNEKYVKEYCFQELDKYVKSPEFDGTQFDEAYIVTINLDTCVTLVTKPPVENLM